MDSLSWPLHVRAPCNENSPGSGGNEEKLHAGPEPARSITKQVDGHPDRTGTMNSGRLKNKKPPEKLSAPQAAFA